MEPRHEYLPTELCGSIRVYDSHRDQRDEETFLLLHGLGNSLDYWTAVAPLLASRRRTIAIDIPGFGQSMPPGSGLTLTAITADIRELMSALGLREVVVVGHSMGAFVALELAATSAEVSRVVLVDGTLFRASGIIQRPIRALAHPRLTIAIASQFLGAMVRIREPFARLIAKSQILRRLALWPFVAQPRALSSPLIVAALRNNAGLSVSPVLRVAKGTSLRRLARRVPQPVDMAWGGADRLIDQSDIDVARRILSIGRECELPHCGHWPMIEQPKELATFLLDGAITAAAPKPKAAAAFDPYQVLPWAERLRDWNSVGFPHWPSRRLLSLLPIITLLAVSVTAYEGTLGTLRDVRPLDDLRRLAQLGGVGPSPARLPFVRDYPAWLLATAIVLTCVIVHRQWRLMRECLQKLGPPLSSANTPTFAGTGVTLPKNDVVFKPIHIAAGYRRLLSSPKAIQAFGDEGYGCIEGRELDFLAWRLNRWLRHWRKLIAPLFLVSATIVVLVLATLRDHGFFEVLAPHLSGHERDLWARRLYQEWWAGVEHPIGLVFYATVGTFGVFVILLQNLVGLTAVYLVAGIPVLSDVRVDWRNHDGCHGWAPLATVYRTVRWSLTLHGLTLTMLLIVLGLDNFGWLWLLLALWVIALLAYTVIPLRMARAIADQARRTEILRIRAAQTDAERRVSDDWRKIQLEAAGRRLTADIEETKIRVLGGGKFGTRAIFITYVFPVVLTAADVIAG